MSSFAPAAPAPQPLEAMNKPAPIAAVERMKVLLSNLLFIFFLTSTETYQLFELLYYDTTPDGRGPGNRTLPIGPYPYMRS